MENIICITNRKLCNIDFLTRIEQIAMQKPRAIIVREKDLPEAEYEKLYIKVREICDKYEVPCLAHNYPNIAKKYEGTGLHLPLHVLREWGQALQKSSLQAQGQTSQDSSLQVWGQVQLGASCHSVEDAIEAEKLGCTYIIAGHIFETDCKKGLAGRGLEFLKAVVNSVSIPVYAIGGINAENMQSVLECGVKGVCIMSGLMIDKSKNNNE